MRLSNKVAIITGGGTGIGRATAVLFAKEGAKVVVAGRTVATLKQTVDLVKEAGGEAMYVQADVSNSEQAQKIADKTIEVYGKIDVLFNCAGVGYSSKYFMGSLVDTPEEDWDAVIDINLKSVFLMCKFIIPHMIRNKGGAIVNCSSINGVIGCGADTYSASKGGIISLTRALAVDNGKYNIRVNSVAPAATETPMIEKALEQREFRDYWSSVAPINGIVSPEDVANAVLFMVSDEAAYITGQNLMVDGGLSIS